MMTDKVEKSPAVHVKEWATITLCLLAKFVCDCLKEKKRHC
ncbi:hypothetical protein [Jeotgalibacillus marinus]|uniref:Uncharacterized protein n=1 Tax=Jeotgalibacillus marinus TaxID=86667 RepID=A0ABV3Q1L9_9BACL